MNVRAFDVPPPPPSFKVDTVTGIDAGAVTSAAGIAAVIPAGLLKVVVRGVPFHRTTEHGTRVLPVEPVEVTSSANAGDFAATLDGVSWLIVGIGSGVVDGVIVKVEDAEASDGIVALETVTDTGPEKAVSTAEIAAVSCVALTNVVGRGDPFQFTVKPLATKFVPFTVSVMPDGLHSGVVLAEVLEAESDEIVGRTIGSATAFDMFVLPAGLATAIWAVCTMLRFAGGTVAVSCVELT